MNDREFTGDNAPRAPRLEMIRVMGRTLRVGVWRAVTGGQSGAARPLLFFNGIGANGLTLALPGWKNVLSDQQLWQLVTFLNHMSELPPAAKQVFSAASPQMQLPASSH